MLVFVTTVDELVTNLKINHHRSGEAIRQEGTTFSLIFILLTVF